MSKIKITSRIKETLSALNTKTDIALEACGLLAESYAQENLTQAHAVDTGNLRNSIQHKVADKDMYVGTNTEYAVYVEMGTGIYTSGGRQTPWSYQDRNGKWHRTSGMRARPFIKTAISEHADSYLRVIEDTYNEE